MRVGGGDYIGGDSEFDSSSRRAGGSSSRRMGARLWEKEKGMLVVNWVDMAGGGVEGGWWGLGGILGTGGGGRGESHITGTQRADNKHLALGGR